MKQHVTIQKARGIGDFPSEDVGKLNDVSISGNISPIGPDHETALLNIRLGEAETALDKARRRIERLLGERNQLGTLLAMRDEQIQTLNRELGAQRFVNADQRPSETIPSLWKNVLAALTRKIGSEGRVMEAKSGSLFPKTQDKITKKKASKPDFGRPPLVVNFKKASPQAVLAVVLFGLDESEIRNLLPVIARDCSASDMMPLVLTDNDAFELLREQGMVFEYLPPAEDREQFSRQLSWDLYIQRRLSIIRQKWQPTRIIALGQVAADTLRLWHESPFEEIPLPAVVKTT